VDKLLLRGHRKVLARIDGKHPGGIPTPSLQGGAGSVE
jgi:hypothetical protein